ncbi:MAG: glycerate kinase [Eubacteriales bacterium]
MRKDADKIIEYAIQTVLPDKAVKRAINQIQFGSGKVYLVAIGKASWQMTKAVYETIGERVEKGIVITKYNHTNGELPNIQIYEAGHPVPDENSFQATKKAVELVSDLQEDDSVLLLISGGGSALFEQPLIPFKEIEAITEQLLMSGANIVEINTIRKRLSAVKGGKFAKICEPAKVYSIILSDIIGDPIDMIASGPAYPDTSTYKEALDILLKYKINLTEEARKSISIDTPKELNNVQTCVIGSVKQLCKAAEIMAKQLGYETILLTDCIQCEAKSVGQLLGYIAQTHKKTIQPKAYIIGGETVVKVTGTGVGGRNQEIALSGALEIQGIDNVAIFSVGSDGTDGPTDAAGGYCDGETVQILKEQDIDAVAELENNNSYYALEKSNGLIKIGATGTNVNDLTMLLIGGKMNKFLNE